MAEDKIVHYRAKSMVISRTMIVNAIAFIVALLAEPTYVAVLPPVLLPVIAIVLPPLNLYLRTIAVRPVAFIKPGDTKPVPVEKLA
jgi:hypothetical protein